MHSALLSGPEPRPQVDPGRRLGQLPVEAARRSRRDWHDITRRRSLVRRCSQLPQVERRQRTTPRPMTWGFIWERVTRIELALSAWEADVLPLNYTRA